MGTLKLNGIIMIALVAALLSGCETTSTTQNGTTTKKSATAASTGARQTGTHMR